MKVWMYTLISVVVISSFSVIMGFVALSIKREVLNRMLLFLVSFAVGTIFGDVFIHILPESFRQFGCESISAPLYIILGFLMFFIVEKFVRWRHYNMHTSAEHMKPVVAMNLIGDGVHNLIDGMLIGASYLISIPIGIATTIAVTFHEIPQEVGDFAVLISGGLSVRKALVFNLLSGLVAVIGAVIALIVGQNIEGFTAYVLPIAAGGLLYIAGPDLIPELHHEVKIPQSVLQFIGIILGVGVMVLLTLMD